jgi:hypothetical protein
VCRGGVHCASVKRLNAIKLAALQFRYYEVLDLSGLHLKRLPRDYFLGLEHVHNLNLSNNDFEALDFWSLEHLTNLTSFTIKNNPHLRYISYAVHYVSDTLINLNCVSCPLLVNDTDLFTIHFLNLQNLTLSGCGLKFVPHMHAFAWKAPQLISLDLSCNRIRVLHPNAFKFLHMLHHLDLDYNELTTFDPACLSPRCRLVNLSLCYNKITTLDGFATPSTRRLGGLNLEHNFLHHLPKDTFKGMNHLEVVNLTENKLAYLEAGLFTDRKGEIHVTLDGNLRFAYIDRNCFSAESQALGAVRLTAFETPLLATTGDGYGLLAELLEVQDAIEAAIKKSRFEAIEEDLIAAAWHPSRVERLLEHGGFEALEAF